MKKKRTRRSSPRPAAHRYTLLRLEQLEDRTLPSVAKNVFATFGGQIAQASPTQQIAISLNSQDFTGSNQKPILGFEVLPAAGSYLNPAVVTIKDSKGTTITPQYSAANIQ